MGAPVEGKAKLMEVNELVLTERNSKIDKFQPGDTVKVSIRVQEGDRQRTQTLEGVVIRSRGSGSDASFTIRRVCHEIGVERTFLFNSPTVEAVELVRQGKVRRARLYYLRERSGRQARIKEDRSTRSS